MNFKFKLTLLLLMLLSVSFYAQDTYLIKGVVSSQADNEPLPGVSVIIVNTIKGIDTDFDGNYSLKVKKGDVLQFSYVGFKNKKIPITGQKTLNVSLEEDANVLDEVVVVGYGTQKQKNLTNAVSKVSSEVLEKSITPRIDDALRGQVAGVNITTAGGEVGGDTRITIRGTGSISGTSAPLVVVDGIALGTDPDLLGSIDPNNVESIEVLKDASSTAIYGSRGANGVIIVTLKEGVEGDTKFSYNTYTGLRFAKKNDNFNLSIGQEEARVERLFTNEDFSGYTDDQLATVTQHYLDAKSELQAAKFIAAANGGETDWQDVLFDGGLVTSHSFSARGGSELSTFDASVSYIKDEGILINDQFERFNARLKVTSKTKNKKIKYGGTVDIRYTDQDRLPSSFTDPIRQTSFLPEFFNEATLAYVNPFPDGLDGDNIYVDGTLIRLEDLVVGSIGIERAFDGVFQADGNGGIIVDANGVPVIDPEYNGISLSSTANNGPRSYYDLRSRTKDQFTGRGSAFIEFKLADGLKFKQSINGNYRTTRNTNFVSSLSHRNQALESEREEQIDTRLQLNVESLFTYKKSFGDHNFNLIGGFSFDKWDYTRTFFEVTGAFSDDFTSNISQADADGGNTQSFTLLGEEKLVSYFGRLNYNYDDKYLFGATLRTDGSTRFGPETRYGFFPSVSVGWNISNENFLSDSDLISNFKLRASYGISGTNEIDSDVFNSLYRSQALASSVSVFDELGRKVTNLGDPTLSWEQQKELNLGVDFGFFNGVLTGSIDVYDKKSEDLILDLQVPSVIGANTQLQNIGQVQNRGFELELAARLVSNENFSWNVSGNFFTNRNEVLSLGGADSFITVSEDSSRPTQWITEVGGPISAFYGYVQDTSKEIPLHAFTNGPFDRYDLESQDVFVVDINGDGIIDTDDRTVLGSAEADFSWSFTNQMDFYNFDFGFTLAGEQGGERRVGDLGTIRNADFSPSGLTGEFLANNLVEKRIQTSAHIQDASFVALRNINLGYTIPSDLTGKYGIDKLRLYVTGEHLLYFFADGYEGWNPEALRTTGNVNLATTRGFQRGDTPISRTVSVGLQLDF